MTDTPTLFQGLSEEEAAERLRRDGYNELPAAKPKRLRTIALQVVEEPMILLLLATGGLYLILGDRREALMLLGFVFVIMGITFYQTRKTERTLEALRDLTSPRALVIRSGEQRRIAGREVVRGDLVLLSEGDRVPADGILLSAVNLSVDESLLTGESVPVRKNEWDGKRKRTAPGGEDLPFVFASTLVIRGRGTLRVEAIGPTTEVGKIGKALQRAVPEQTLLQKETGRLVRILAGVGLFLCFVVVVVYGLTRGDWLGGFLAGLTLAMATLPEEFPVVLMVFLALGAWRISRQRVLTRSVPAIETLGAATVLCVDKTGTLTFNRMSVDRLDVDGKYYDAKESGRPPLPELFHELALFGLLASQQDPFDPVERAIIRFAKESFGEVERPYRDWRLIREYPLSSQLLAMSQIWETPEGTIAAVAAKGAPEAIFDLSHLSATETALLSSRVGEMASKGLRLLGVAKGNFRAEESPGAFPEKQHEISFTFLGLIGLADPIRPTVPPALRQCAEAGIRVVMITGDYPVTAQSIARQIGLAPAENVLTGAELDAMNDRTLQERLKTTHLFARVVPEQKLRLVEALKAGGEVVAMTGDGVNDAPALKSAQIGIAMGGRGTDVAREAADLVLLDDDFSSIVGAIEVGRRIFDNLQKAMVYILAIHIPIAGLSLIPVIFQWPLILLPVHIVFLELIIDPACSVIFEAEPAEADVMRRPPRDRKRPLFDRSFLSLSLWQGVGVLLIAVGVFAVSFFHNGGEKQARALTFTTLVFANLGLIFANRSRSKMIFQTFGVRNPALWMVVMGAILFLGLTLFVPTLRDLFQFNQLRPLDLAVSGTAGILSVLWCEGLKSVQR